MAKMSEWYTKRCAEVERKISEKQRQLNGVMEHDDDILTDIQELEEYSEYLAEEQQAWEDAERKEEQRWQCVATM